MLQLSSGKKWRSANKHCFIYIAMPSWGFTCIIGGQRSVKIALSPLPPHHSDPATRDFKSIAGNRRCWWRRPSTFRWHPQKSTSTEMEDWKSLVAGPLWWWGREGGAILTNLWPPMTCILSSAWQCLFTLHHFHPDDDEAFCWNVWKFFLQTQVGNRSPSSS